MTAAPGLAGELPGMDERQPKYVIIGTWLCEDLGTCNCGAGHGFYAHEPYCGIDNIVDLKTLSGYSALYQHILDEANG